MNEKPLLYSTPMVRATMDGLKTQTRRVITANNTVGFSIKKKLLDFSQIYPNGSFGVKVKELASDALWRGQCKWQPGDWLYVRETWCLGCEEADPYCHCDTEELREQNHFYVYKADTPDAKYPLDWDDVIEGWGGETADFVPKWKPSIHMPKKAARIWLRVKDVRVERVQDISEQDAIAEGVDGSMIHEIETGPSLSLYGGPVIGFRKLWNSINQKRGFGWDVNPYVWSVSFEVMSTNGKPEGV